MKRFNSLLLVVTVLGLLTLPSGAVAGSLSGISGALSDANAEARGPILTSLAGILAAVVLIGVGAGIVRAITRSQ